MAAAQEPEGTGRAGRGGRGAVRPGAPRGSGVGRGKASCGNGRYCPVTAVPCLLTGGKKGLNGLKCVYGFSAGGDDGIFGAVPS